MVFDLQKFLQSPDVNLIQQLKKAELFEFVEHFSLDVKQSARKLEVRNAVILYLINERILDRSAMSLVVELEKVTRDYSQEIQLKQLEREIEKERFEQERERFAQEHRKREHEIQIKQLEIENQRLRNKEAEIRNASKMDFDVVKNARLVPKFHEKDVDKFFVHFEKNSCQFEVAQRVLANAITECFYW
jgi:hypothetical protein